jgi:hypothetical protein
LLSVLPRPFRSNVGVEATLEIYLLVSKFAALARR